MAALGAAPRGARGLGSPEVEAGRRGVVLAMPAIAVPARVTAKEPGRSWTWRVGPVTMRHSVEPCAEGCRVAVELDAIGAIEALMAVSYGALITPLLRNLASVAAGGDAGPPADGSRR